MQGEKLAISRSRRESVRHGDNSFVFRNCRFSVKTKSGRKDILKGISGEVHSGHVLAIMGPSGAGKTTLLNLLSLNPLGGFSSGHVAFNGSPVTDKIFREHMSIVSQEDTLWPFLTCREALEYAADFSLSGPAEEKKVRVDELIDQLGLQSCQHTKCGNQFFKGLSGGQKRRLSLAIALIKDPAVVFLDEPTSGLDSASASAVMGHLKRIAEGMNIIVLCTIHQPSTAVFNSFDSTMLLSDGHVVYCGPAQDSIRYFNDIGRPMPGHMNPAEYMLDLVNADFTSKQEVNLMIEEWVVRGEAVKAPRVVAQPRSFHATGVVRQTMTHLRRSALLSVRDPMLYIGRMAMFIFACSFFAIIYIKCRDRNQDQVTPRMFLCLWFMGVPIMMGVIAVFGLNQEFLDIKRELKNGFYHPVSYLIAHTIIQVPYMALLAIASFSVSGYGIANFNPEGFGRIFVTYTLTFWAFECIAQLLSLIRNPLLGMLTYVNFWFVAFLFAGFFAREVDVIWPFKFFVYILPMRWSIAAVVRTEFLGSTWGQASLSDTSPVGFVCEEGVQLCFGRTGHQVLSSLAMTFPLFSPDDSKYWQEMGYILAIGIVFKALFYLGFMLCIRSGKPVSTASSESPSSVSSAAGKTRLSTSAREETSSSMGTSALGIPMAMVASVSGTLSFGRDAPEWREGKETLECLSQSRPLPNLASNGSPTGATVKEILMPPPRAASASLVGNDRASKVVDVPLGP